MLPIASFADLDGQSGLGLCGGPAGCAQICYCWYFDPRWDRHATGCGDSNYSFRGGLWALRNIDLVGCLCGA